MIFSCSACAKKKRLYLDSCIAIRHILINRLTKMYSKNNIVKINTDKCYFYYLDCPNSNGTTLRLDESSFEEKNFKIIREKPRYCKTIFTDFCVYPPSISINFSNIYLPSIKTLIEHPALLILNKYPYIILQNRYYCSPEKKFMNVTFEKYVKNIETILLKIPNIKKFRR